MTNIDQLPFVEAELNYLAPMTERPRYYAYEPQAGEPRSNLTPEPHRMQIYTLRPIAGDLGLDVQGFALLEQRSAVQDFWDDDEVRRVYYPEAERFLKEATGASRIFIFDHLQRRRVEGQQDRSRSGPRQPATRVHVDHTDRSGPQRVRDLMGDEAEALLTRRAAIINVWRPIAHEARDWPLAFADARSVAPEDLIAQDLIFPHRRGEIYGVAHNPNQRWRYVPDLRPDETILIKCWDSDPSVARFTPHTAFEDPTTPQGTAPRESIEFRTIAFFD
jgi:hypothetical protein